MKNASNDTFVLIRGTQGDFADRHEDAVELRVLHVLEHHALGALLLDDAFVVRGD